jgi:(S)-2-hydroxy-acid oxidase
MHNSQATQTQKVVVPISVEDFRKSAEKKMEKMFYDYYASGAGDQITLKDNEEAFTKIKILPRFMVDVSKVDLTTKVLGQKIPSPICIAATAMHKLAEPVDGEISTAKAAAETKTLMCLSSLSTTDLEDLAKAVPEGLKWFQLYVLKDREFTSRIVQRAEKSGYKALVLTVDTPILGSREADHRNGFQLPSGVQLAHYKEVASDSHLPGYTGQSGLNSFVARNLDAALKWEDVTWLCKKTKLPVLVKGIMHPDDAVKAIKAGVRGIIVSNHGARQLDTVPATIEVLPDIVAAVKKEDSSVEVYLDGGIRRGTDVLKAIALGARAVFVGRPVLWGLAHNGKEGVKAVLTLLNKELESSMVLSGCRTVRDINREILYRPKKKLTSKL